MKFYLLLLIIIDRTSYELINMYVPWYICRQGLSDSSALPSCYAVIRCNWTVDHDCSWNSWVAAWLSCKCISMIYIVPSCTVESIGILEVSRVCVCVWMASAESYLVVYIYWASEHPCYSRQRRRLDDIRADKASAWRNHWGNHQTSCCTVRWTNKWWRWLLLWIMSYGLERNAIW